MSRVSEGMFSSQRQNWTTPQPFFDLLDKEFGFTLDAAASVENAKCRHFFDETTDGLQQTWTGVVWCNPPYGRTIAAWVCKGFESAHFSADVVVMLIPARTDTTYWHDYVMKASEVRLLRGRLVFGSGDAISNAPFPSALVVFRRGAHHPVFTTMTRGTLTKRRPR